MDAAGGSRGLDGGVAAIANAESSEATAARLRNTGWPA